MLESPRVRASAGVLNVLRSNPYVKPEQSSAIACLLNTSQSTVIPVAGSPVADSPVTESEPQVDEAVAAKAAEPAVELAADETGDVPDEAVSAYLAEHATEIAADQDKPFQPVGGIVDLLGADYFPVSENKEMTEIAGSAEKVAAEPASVASAATEVS